ncbi:MAG: ATP-binding cassette domain-containing protein [Bacilli bacterium]
MTFVRAIMKHNPVRLVNTFVLMGLNILLDGIGIVLILPLLALAGFLGDDWGFQSFDVTPFRDAFSDVTPTVQLIVLFAVFLSIIGVRAGVGYVYTMQMQRYIHTFSHKLRTDLYDALIARAWWAQRGSKRTNMQSTLTAELDQIEFGTQIFFTFVQSFVYITLALVAGFAVNSTFTAVILCSGLVVSLLLRRTMRRSQVLGHELLHFGRDYFETIGTYFDQMKDVKSAGLEEVYRAELRNVSRDMKAWILKYQRTDARVSVVYKLVGAGVVCVLLFLALEVMGLPTAEWTMIALLVARIYPHFAQVQSTLHEWLLAVPVWASYEAMLREARSQREESQTSVGELTFNKGLAISDASFTFHDETEPTFQRVNGYVAKGEFLLIKGVSGSGKSTFVDCLLGLYPLSEGEIRADGRLVFSHLKAWRDRIAYVSQTPLLVPGTIRRNLTLYRQEGYTDDELWAVLDECGASGFVALLGGLDVVVGDGGQALSGGEVQRLIIARALLKRPDILILDEATNALDDENERWILEKLRSCYPQMTCIVVAHQSTAGELADQVWHLKDRRIVKSVRSVGYVSL